MKVIECQCKWIPSDTKDHCCHRPAEWMLKRISGVTSFYCDEHKNKILNIDGKKELCVVIKKIG